MRQLQTAGLVAAVALALAAGAQAATTTRATTPGGTVSGQPGTFIMTSPRIAGPVNAVPAAATGTGTTTTTTTAPQNTTTVDVRAQQNQQAVSSTFASGSTSALGPLAGTATTTTGTAGSGTTSGAGTGTPVSVGGTTTGGTTGITTGGGVAAFGNVGTAVGVPIFTNPADVTFANGTPTTIASVATTPTYTNADIYAGSLVQNGVVSEAQANGANVDRAIAQVSRDRKRIGRNGQLLYSIAPRSNGVDRTAQMADDGPSPALTGSNSTLTR